MEEWFLQGVLCCGRVSLKAIRSFLASLNGRLVVISEQENGGSNCCKIVVDGAWKASSCQGAAAWCGLPEYLEDRKGVTTVFCRHNFDGSRNCCSSSVALGSFKRAEAGADPFGRAVEVISGIKEDVCSAYDALQNIPG